MKLFWTGAYILLLITSVIPHTQAQKNLPTDVTKLWNRAKNQERQKAYKQATHTYNQAIDLFISQTQHPSYQLVIARLYNELAMLHSTDKLANFQKFYDYQEKAAKAIQQTNDKQYKGEILYQTAISYYYYQRFKEAAPLLEQVIRLAQATKDYNLEIKALNIIGRVYLTLSMYELSLNYLEKAERLLNQHVDVPDAHSGQTFFNLGIAYHLNENHTAALAYTKKSLPLWISAYGAEHFRVVAIYNQMARFYFLLGQSKQTKHYLDKVFAIDNPQVRKGRGGCLTLLGEVYHKEKNYPKAIEAFREAIKIQINTFGSDTPDNTEIYQHLSKTYKASKEFAKALTNIQQALILNNSLFTSVDLKENPTLKGAIYSELQIHLLSNKADIWRSWYDATQHKGYLLKAHKIYDFLLKEVKNWKTSMNNENNLLLLIKRSNYIFTNAIEVLHKLHELTQKDQYLAEAFSVAEQAKAYILLRSLYVTSKSKHNQTNTLENGITEKLNHLQELLISEEGKQKPDTRKIIQYKDKIFTLQAGRDSLLQAFQKFAPEYYQTKYQFKIASVQSIQQKLLTPHDALIEYMLADNQLFIFMITNQNIHLQKISLSDNFSNKVKALRQSITNKNFTEFTRLSHWFYQKLVKDLPIPSKVRHLKIVPSGVLYHLPWEALITQQANPKAVDYSKLDYLLKKYTVSYDYSATLMLKKVAHLPVTRKAKLLAFSPDFKAQLATANVNNDKLRNSLAPLTGARDEVKTLNKLYAGNLFLGQQATEQQFRTHLKNASVLHLATHAIVNDEQPAFSRLLFSLSNQDTLHDGYLHVYELYNLQLNAELVTLSACNTGFGKIQTGEGVISLGRAFAYAGSPNVLMSLWSVPDKSTSQIMIWFYKNLADGMPKDVALQKAKLAYITQSDNITANPFYWSSFVLIGDPKPLSLQPIIQFYRQGMFIWCLAMFFVGSIFLLIRKRFFS